MIGLMAKSGSKMASLRQMGHLPGGVSRSRLVKTKPQERHSAGVTSRCMSCGVEAEADMSFLLFFMKRQVCGVRLCLKEFRMQPLNKVSA